MPGTKNVVPLSTWSLERRGRYWHITKPAFFTDPAASKGPYSSIVSATLMIARELAKEAAAKFYKK